MRKILIIILLIGFNFPVKAQSITDILANVAKVDPGLYLEILDVVENDDQFAKDIEERTVPMQTTSAELEGVMYRAAEVCQFNSYKARVRYPIICKKSNFIGIMAYKTSNHKLDHRVLTFDPSMCDLISIDEESENGEGTLGYGVDNWSFQLGNLTPLGDPNRLFVREYEGANYLVAIFYTTPRGVDNSCPQKYIYLIEFKADTVELKDTKVITLQPGHYPKGLGCHTDDPHEEEDYWGHRPEFYQDVER